MEARIFPVFYYNPKSGNNWASHLSIKHNAQVENNWPIHTWNFADTKGQRVSQQTPFTFIDYALCDNRYNKHFALAENDKINSALLVPLEDFIKQQEKYMLNHVPFLYAIDKNNILQKVIIDKKLIKKAVACQKKWNLLQESGGINNSHANNLITKEKTLWEKEKEELLSSQTVLTENKTALPIENKESSNSQKVEQILIEETVEQEIEQNPDEAYIETFRCASCNECIQINDKMFVYNEDKQAYIADINAGTYRELVEAAENCQVAIIHPGKPRNANEAGLDELLKRAELFL